MSTGWLSLYVKSSEYLQIGETIIDVKGPVRIAIKAPKFLKVSRVPKSKEDMNVPEPR